jgi:hypothetical protein
MKGREELSSGLGEDINNNALSIFWTKGGNMRLVEALNKSGIATLEVENTRYFATNIKMYKEIYTAGGRTIISSEKVESDCWAPIVNSLDWRAMGYES